MTGKTSKTLTEEFALEACDNGTPSFLMRDFRLNSMLLFDQHDGLGHTVINQLAGRRGCIVFMEPDVFLSLAAAGIVHDSTKFIMRGLKQYKGTDSFPLASPWLMVNFEKNVPTVRGHEGRNRMRAIKRLKITDDIPVVIDPFSMSGNDVVDVTKLSRLLQGAQSQDGHFLGGPLFSKAVIGDQTYQLKV